MLSEYKNFYVMPICMHCHYIALLGENVKTIFGSKLRIRLAPDDEHTRHCQAIRLAVSEVSPARCSLQHGQHHREELYLHRSRVPQEKEFFNGWSAIAPHPSRQRSERPVSCQPRRSPFYGGNRNTAKPQRTYTEQLLTEARDQLCREDMAMQENIDPLWMSHKAVPRPQPTTGSWSPFHFGEDRLAAVDIARPHLEAQMDQICPLPARTYPGQVRSSNSKNHNVTFHGDIMKEDVEPDDFFGKKETSLCDVGCAGVPEVDRVFDSARYGERRAAGHWDGYIEDHREVLDQSSHDPYRYTTCDVTPGQYKHSGDQVCSDWAWECAGTEGGGRVFQGKMYFWDKDCSLIPYFVCCLFVWLLSNMFSDQTLKKYLVAGHLPKKSMVITFVAPIIVISFFITVAVLLCDPMRSHMLLCAPTR